MKRSRQTVEEILGQLSRVESSWEDDRSRKVIDLLNSVPDDPSLVGKALLGLFEQDHDAGLLITQLALDVSKDEFRIVLADALSRSGLKVSSIRREPAALARALSELKAVEALSELVVRPVTWRSILCERLKSGRGSAIKGQRRGRALEQFAREVVASVFGESYAVGCRFIGADGESTEKADIAIPSAVDPQILIEVKAYGATGSKQTDILGDVSRIVAQKRRDTHFLLVTDGITWNSRVSDLSKLVAMQNCGDIARIYTQSMKEVLRADLAELKASLRIA